jgi:hypothetical protein
VGSAIYAGARSDRGQTPHTESKRSLCSFGAGAGAGVLEEEESKKEIMAVYGKRFSVSITRQRICYLCEATLYLPCTFCGIHYTCLECLVNSILGQLQVKNETMGTSLQCFTDIPDIYMMCVVCAHHNKSKRLNNGNL